MTGTRHTQPRIKPFWLSTWPLWTLIVFASLAAVRLLPAYARATVAAPVLFMVPGSLTLGAVFNPRCRPHGLVFVCYAALLGVAWSAFASLALYVDGKLITAQNTYWCLLALSAVLAIAAEARLLLGRPGRGRRAGRGPKAVNQSDAQTDDIETPAGARGAAYYSIVAVVAGVCLLAGGLYVYDRVPHPASTGYTWISWTGPPIEGDIAITPTGKKLSFEIVHRKSDTTVFKLSAAWIGSRSTPLAKPITFSIGPNQTFQGTLTVPPLPDGCTYRIAVTLIAPGQIDPLTKEPQTWSINADVHNLSKSSKACK